MQHTLKLILLSSVWLFSQSLFATPQIVASIAPVNALVAAVTAGVTTPTLLISPTASPHHYQLKPSEVHALSEADVIVWVGPDMETFLPKVLQNVSPHAAIVTLLTEPDVITLQTNHHVDPHIWLLPDNAKVIVRAVAESLCIHDAKNCDIYTKNAEEAIARIDVLDDSVREKLAPVKSVPYLVFHDAYRYFEAHYGLSNQGTITLSPERQVSAKHLVALQEKIAEDNIVCVFNEPQLQASVVEMLIKTTDVQEGELDPVGINITPDLKGYEQLLTGLANGFVNCLRLGK